LNTNGLLDPTFKLLEPSWSTVTHDISLAPDGKILTSSELLRLNEDGTLDDGFAPPLIAADIVQLTLQSIALQTNGNILVAGNFDWVNGVRRPRIARLLPNGAFDQSFQPIIPTELDSQAIRFPSVACLQADQKILLWFSSFMPGQAGPSESMNLVRLNPDGSRDNGFNLSMRFLPSDLGVQLALQRDGRIILARNSQTNSALLRLSTSGAADPSFHPVFAATNGTTIWFNDLLVQPDDKVIVAGNFSAVDGVPRRNLARLNADGSVDLTFDPGTGADAPVKGLALNQNGDIIAVGEFSTFNSVPLPGLVRLHGSDATGVRLLGCEWRDGAFRFQVQTEAGKTYVPEFKNGSYGSEWKPMPAILGDGQTQEVRDANPDPGSRIYRLLRR
jgi:uncharacterized delta-60 repeat protein